MFASTVFFYNILLLMFLKFVEDNHMYDPAIMFYTKYQLSQVLIYLIPLVISISIYIFFFADTRDIDEQRRNIVIEKIQHSATKIAIDRGVRLSEFKIINQDPPALAEKTIIEAMEAASKELNLKHKLMISRAYHDSLFMARYVFEGET